MKLSQSLVVEAPAAFCFECLARIEDAPKHMSILKSLRMLTPGGPKVGARWRETVEVFGRRINLEATMVEMDPPRGYRFETNHRGVRMSMGFELTPKGDRQTLVDLKLEGVGSTLVGKLALASATPFLGRVRATAAQELNGLKLAIENEYRSVSQLQG
ncbi:SRPBCC family protein [Neomegalonema sp.]|uniref:SRPBCC family protein n=1 Tax=Neomegalonema sp. TaxID=2039713 RepID=UPI00261E36C8|nr:SRPBCC family protein [Neomegalonema sp.]MDD2869886.1 SRPBCC family protein [Neomegalonema sp.]